MRKIIDSISKDDVTLFESLKLLLKNKYFLLIAAFTASPFVPKIIQAEVTMKTYSIMSAKGNDYLSVLNETEVGYMVRIFKDEDGYEKITDDFMSSELFEMCVRTGYLVETEEKKKEATA